MKWSGLFALGPINSGNFHSFLKRVERKTRELKSRKVARESGENGSSLISGGRESIVLFFCPGAELYEYLFWSDLDQILELCPRLLKCVIGVVFEVVLPRESKFSSLDMTVGEPIGDVLHGFVLITRCRWDLLVFFKSCEQRWSFPSPNYLAFLASGVILSSHS